SHILSLIPVFPGHHPDESHPAMSLTVVLDGLCLSVGTASILEIYPGRATPQTLQDISMTIAFENIISI
ncbi:hypothetical protein, partial [Pseudomonas ficuserectae]